MNGVPSATATGGGSGSASTKKAQDSKDHSSPGDQSSTRVAHTLTACTRCRQRKTRCDPGLPRCGPCDRNNAVCEYWDPAKHRNINRDYVVWLQQRVRDLEHEMDKVEREDSGEETEVMVRSGAAVKIADADESKYLGPSSGTQLTRLVMQLAKQFTDAKTIKDIVPEATARQAKELYVTEADKPTSKIYPLISSVAAEDLPNRGLTDLLVQLYILKVQPMYPALHEPTFLKDVEFVYQGQGNDYQNYVLRMVIAISLQKMDTQYAGLADSYYLAALKYMEAVVRPMDLGTLQCFALVAQYSLLTPTRTAIYYIVGLGVRLSQALGIHEEKTITRGKAGTRADYLEVDMRRRLFWCIFVMECGLSHSLGRPASLAMGREHIDVGFFDTCADDAITREGVLPGTPRPTLKKWIAIHFFKMRLLQLEIRRKLYLRKRPAPANDQDPWFQQMLAKLEAWRDASPNKDEGSGLDKTWFVGRFYTMIAFLFRPSPQIPRPSLAGALKCFEAAKFNIHMTRKQIDMKNVDLTWIFTQAIFMAVNTMLWSLSYSEIRKQNPRAEVEKHLEVGMESIRLSSERWPGVASAHQLYLQIIGAILKIYDKTGDVPIQPNTPSDSASPHASSSTGPSGSRQGSPATFASSSLYAPNDNHPPFGYFRHPARRSVEQPPPLPYKVGTTPPATASSPVYLQPTSAPRPSNPTSPESVTSVPYAVANPSDPQGFPNESIPQFQPLPNDFSNLAMTGWNSACGINGYTDSFGARSNTQMQPMNDFTDPRVIDYGYQDLSSPDLQQQATEYTDPNYWNQTSMDVSIGLNTQQQLELMRSLETDGMEDINTMIAASTQFWNNLQQQQQQQQGRG